VSSRATTRAATLSDFLAIPEGERQHELLAGEIVRRAVPSGEHGGAQGDVLISLGPPFQRGKGGPGGWWFDPHAATLTVMRWADDGYTTVLAAERGEVVRAEPFDAIELEVSALLGDADR
jgi:Uma2 family endonuclease